MAAIEGKDTKVYVDGVLVGQGIGDIAREAAQKREAELVKEARAKAEEEAAKEARRKKKAAEYKLRQNARKRVKSFVESGQVSIGGLAKLLGVPPRDIRKWSHERGGPNTKQARVILALQRADLRKASP